MSKAKKTRQEKMIAELHRKLQQQKPQSTASSSEQKGYYTYSLNHTPMSTPTITPTTNVALIRHDLFKTALVTFAVVALQLALFFLLKTHVIKIPMISY